MQAPPGPGALDPFQSPIWVFRFTNLQTPDYHSFPLFPFLFSHSSQLHSCCCCLFAISLCLLSHIARARSEFHRTNKTQHSFLKSSSSVKHFRHYTDRRRPRRRTSHSFINSKVTLFQVIRLDIVSGSLSNEPTESYTEISYCPNQHPFIEA